jgi:rhodanese-related sulfurtransferase
MIRGLVLCVAFLLCCSAAAAAAAADAPSAVAATTTTRPAIEKVGPGEFEKILADRERKDVVLLDVRTPEEFAHGHIAGATNLNYRAKDFGEQVAKLDKSKTYLVYCAVGGRSTSACEKMAKLDFAHLYNLDGGISRWQREGKKVEKDNEGK